MSPSTKLTSGPIIQDQLLLFKFGKGKSRGTNDIRMTCGLSKINDTKETKFQVQQLLTNNEHDESGFVLSD